VSGKTRGITFSPAMLVLWALMPASIWAAAMKHVGETIGYHSTPGIWLALIGFPGVVVGAWISHWTGSDPAGVFVAFVGNWIFCFGVLKATVTLKRRFHRPR
jgi:hypothetical protein